jgi:predicted metal-dependent hydrolase
MDADARHVRHVSSPTAEPAATFHAPSPNGEAQGRAIRPRAPAFAFDDAIPRRWFGGSAVATQLSNGLNLLFPAGERFFVRSVRHYLDRIEDDPELMNQVRGFFGQEGRHANAHERFFEVMDAQGYDTKRFLALYDKIAFAWLERVISPSLRLSITTACEHFTAIMAENALRDDVLSAAHPEMRKLLLWHAAEEIEHKAVAFDVLKRVNPSYALRMAGLAMATAVLTGFWITATLMLLREDGIPLGQARAEMKAIGEHLPIGKNVFGRGIREYIRRDFHPSHNDNYELARAFLTQAGL